MFGLAWLIYVYNKQISFEKFHYLLLYDLNFLLRGENLVIHSKFPYRNSHIPMFTEW